MNPLTDELPDEAKAELAVTFRAMKANFSPWDIEHQRWVNRVWQLPGRCL